MTLRREVTIAYLLHLSDTILTNVSWFAVYCPQQEILYDNRALVEQITLHKKFIKQTETRWTYGIKSAYT